MLDQPRTIASPPPTPVPPARLSGDVMGAMINLSGRRRFTSQRVVLYAVLGSLGHEGALDTARETLALFREAHQTLIKGKGEIPGVFCDALHKAYYGPTQGDKVIVDFITLAEATIGAIDADAKGAPALLDELVRKATPLLSVLNGLTLVYEEQSKRHAQQQRRQLQDIMGDIKVIARQARMVAFNAQVVAARAADAGREFAAVASVMTNITSEIDELIQKALADTVAT